MVASAFAGAVGVGYLPLLVLPWTFEALITRAEYTVSAAGMVGTLEVGALALASLLGSSASVRRNRGRVAAIGVAIAVVANASAALIAPHGIAFLLTRLCSGAGLGVAVAVGNATAAGSRNPTRVFAALWFLMALWQLLIFNVTAWLTDKRGLAGVYGMMALTCLILLPLILRAPDPELSSPANDSTSERRTPAAILVVAMLLAYLTFWLRDSLVYSLSGQLAAHVGIDGSQLGLLLGAASVIGLLGPALAANLGDRALGSAVLAAGLISPLVASMFMAGASWGPEFAAATLVMPGTGLFAASLLSGLAANIDSSGRLAALGAGLGFASEGVGPALAGVLMDCGGQPALTIAVAVSGMVAVAAAVYAATHQRIQRSLNEIHRTNDGPEQP